MRLVHFRPQATIVSIPHLTRLSTRFNHYSSTTSIATELRAMSFGSESIPLAKPDMSPENRSKKQKLHGRDFYQSIGCPKFVLAPMVEQSEFAWRLLSRSYMPPESSKDLLAYTPMFHARMFVDTPKYREQHFQPVRGTIPSPPDSYHSAQSDHYLDGNSTIDRPLFVQFCANKPDELLAAAQHVQSFCDAVDLNLGCPQGIARRGNYGSFLQEEPDTIYSLINTLHTHLDIPVTAKMRILDTKEKTLEYARMIISAGASILTVHGRQRHQKGHNTGLADWAMIRYLRENLPEGTVIFANGNILRHEDIDTCLEATGADAVMSAEGNLYDPTIFAPPPPVGQEGREYWRGRDGKGGYRMDGVLRRYMDIIHRYVFDREPPAREPLYLPSGVPQTETKSEDAASLPSSDPTTQSQSQQSEPSEPTTDNQSNNKRPLSPSSSTQTTTQNKKQKPEKRKGKPIPCTSPNLTAMQAHLFHLLRPLVSKHTHIRDALARCRAGDIPAFENVLSLVEDAVEAGLKEYAADPAAFETVVPEPEGDGKGEEGDHESSLRTVALCKRPWFICQPYVRPLPKEALEKGSLQLTKKEKARLAKEDEETRAVGLEPEGRIEVKKEVLNGEEGKAVEVEFEHAKEGVVCG